MANVSKSVSFSQGDPAAQAYDIQRAQQLAQLLQQQSMQPIESAMPNAPISWTQGLAKMMQAYGAKQADSKVRGLLAQKGEQAQQRQQGLIEALTGTKQVGGVDENNPGFDTQALQAQPGEQPYLNRDKLVAALQGSNPEDTTPALSQLLFQRAQAPQGFTGTLGPDQTAFANGQPVAAGKPKDISLEHVSRPLANDMMQEGTFNKDTGEYKWGVPHKGHEPVGSQPLPAVAADKGAVGMVLTGMPINQAIPGYGRQASAERKAARDGAISQLVIDHPGWSEMDAGTELAKRAIDFAGGKGAGVQTTKQLAANQNFLGTMDKNIANADSLSKEVGGDTSPAMNKLFNMWKRGITGDPKVRQLDIYNNEIQGEAAKLASGGVGSVSATSDTQIAKQVVLLQTADNYAAWRAAAQALQASGGNRISSILETIKSTREAVPGSSAAVAAPPTAKVVRFEDLP